LDAGEGQFRVCFVLDNGEPRQIDSTGSKKPVEGWNDEQRKLFRAIMSGLEGELWWVRDLQFGRPSAERIAWLADLFRDSIRPTVIGLLHNLVSSAEVLAARLEAHHVFERQLGIEMLLALQVNPNLTPESVRKYEKRAMGLIIYPEIVDPDRQQEFAGLPQRYLVYLGRMDYPGLGYTATSMQFLTRSEVAERVKNGETVADRTPPSSAHPYYDRILQMRDV